MTLQEYMDDFCSRCKKCDGSKYHQSHCIDTDIIEETWEACQQQMTDKACGWLFQNFYHEETMVDCIAYKNEDEDINKMIEQFKQAMEEQA